MNLLKDLRNLFIPNRCLHCLEITSEKTLFLCHLCFLSLEQTNFINQKNNALEKLFWGQVNLTEVGALYYYHKKSPIQTLIKSLKYKGLQNIAYQAGLLASQQILNSKRFNHIDIVTIVPLHPKKETKRGYNQVELFGKVIAQQLNIPYHKDLIIKKTNNKSQTTLNKEKRFKSVEHLYSINNEFSIQNKNILLLDDVLTTGATLISCAKVLKKEHKINISILTIACVV